MKYLILALSVLIFLNTNAQTRVLKKVKTTKRELNSADINRLNLETKIVGKTALPALYRFKDKKLILNGAGLRELLWVDVYACGLYLNAPDTSPEDIIDGNEIMIVRMDILSKAVSHKKLVSAFKKGFEDANSPGIVKKLNPEITEFLSKISNLQLKVKDKVDVVYEPEIGVSLYLNYDKIGTVGGIDFKKAIFRIWLSDHPVDKSLRTELLNGAKEFIK